MEEWVGLKWHQYITRKASKDHLDCSVSLDEVGFRTGVLFRALGGPQGMRLLAATPRAYSTRRNWLQKIAGTGKTAQLAWRDEESVRLPEKIALFEDRQLNAKMYVWLAALASAQTDPFANWFEDNQRLSAHVIDSYPGIAGYYRALVEAYLLLRPDMAKLTPEEQVVERAIQQALRSPQDNVILPEISTPPEPVLLWLYPSTVKTDAVISSEEGDEGMIIRRGAVKKHKKRKKAERVDSYDQNQGLMVFRLENLFSWSEFKSVDRAGDDTKEDEAEQVADDLDVLSLSRERKAGASAIRMDLDLPGAENDDLILGDGILLPEWHYKQQQLQQDHCCLHPMIADDAAPLALPDRLRKEARRVKNQFMFLKPERNWIKNLVDGEELVTENWIEFMTDVNNRGAHADQRIFMSKQPLGRSLSCLILADLSLSTDAWINNELQVIDVIRDSLMLMSEALSVTGDRFSIYGFSSRKRNHVRFHILKNFNERYTDQVRGRIESLRPGYYTRMGAAIRQASKILHSEQTNQKVLLLLSDGKPNDLDQYEGRYGVEDTRHAILEARKAGIEPFCVTIDSEAEDYLPHLFGTNGYAVIRDPAELSRQLPTLYVNLTR